LFKAKIKPAANKRVIKPAKYGIISIIFLIIDEFKVNGESKDGGYP